MVCGDVPTIVRHAASAGKFFLAAKGARRTACDFDPWNHVLPAHENGKSHLVGSPIRDMKIRRGGIVTKPGIAGAFDVYEKHCVRGRVMHE